MADDPRLLDSPDKIAEAGERYYNERHRTILEKSSLGQFVAVDVLTGEAYVGQFPEIALDTARKAAANGIFHLIRIGSPGAFRVSFGGPRSKHGFWTGALRHPR